MQVEEIAGQEAAVAAQKKIGKTGGAYIPPFRLAQIMQEAESKTDASYQRLTWDALRKSINGLVNKANAVNIRPILKELLTEVGFLALPHVLPTHAVAMTISNSIAHDMAYSKLIIHDLLQPSLCLR